MSKNIYTPRCSHLQIFLVVQYFGGNDRIQFSSKQDVYACLILPDNIFLIFNWMLQMLVKSFLVLHAFTIIIQNVEAETTLHLPEALY